MPPCASNAPSGKRSPRPSNVPRSRYLAFLIIVATGCGADLWTKQRVFAWLGLPGRDPPHWLWSNVFGFQTSLNPGALFGMGQGLWPIFATLSVVAVLGILYWLFVLRAARHWLLCVALASVTAGILGNLHDRLALHGLRWPPGDALAGQAVHAVRDFVLVMIGSYRWPNFNLADSLLVCGAGLLLWHASRSQPEETPDENRANRAAADSSAS